MATELKTRDAMDYESMSREQLIFHCRSYADAVHSLAQKVQNLIAQQFIADLTNKRD